MNYVQIAQITQYMATRGRVYRAQPVTGLPIPERYSQVERMVDGLWQAADTLGISLGPRPSLVLTGAPMSPPHSVLLNLTLLETEVLCTFAMCGLIHAHGRAVYELLQQPIGTPSPNFRKVVDEVYSIDTDQEDELPE